MSAALTYTKPVCLFELYNGEDASQGSEAQGVPGHNAALLRQLSDESIKDPRKSTVTCEREIDRCGDNDGLEWAVQYRCCTMQQFLM